MAKSITCTCGHSWNKSDSSKKDMYVCHICGKDNSNNMKNGGWLDKYEDELPTAQIGTNIAKTDATRVNKPAPVLLKSKEQIKREAELEKARLAKEVAKRQTSISADNMPADVRERLRAERETNARINEYVANAPLTQSLTAMSRAGNDELGKLAAQTITEANPLFSAARLVNSAKDPANNPYGIDKDAGLAQNALGVLGLVGDATDIGNMMYTPAVQQSLQQIGKGVREVGTSVGSNMMNIAKGIGKSVRESLSDNNQLAPPPSEIIFPSSSNNPNVQKAEKLRSMFWNPSPNSYISEGGLNWLRDNGGVSFRDIYDRNIPIERADANILNHIRDIQRNQIRDLTPREILALDQRGFNDVLSSVVSNQSLRSRLDQGIQSALGMNTPRNILIPNGQRQSALQSFGESIYTALGGRRNIIQEGNLNSRLQAAKRDERILESTSRNYAAANSYNPPRGSVTLNDGTVLAVGGTRDVTNRSGLGKSALLSNDALVNKDVVSKMAPEEFASTVFKPSGEVVPYQITHDPLPGVYGMSPSQYANRFNENLDLLNDIISKQNKTGVEYRVTGLDESGMLTFHTPKQVKRWQDDSVIVKTIEGLEEIKNDPVKLQANNQTVAHLDRIINSFKKDRIIAPEGTKTWAARIIPGEFRGEIQDIPNAEYYKSIPGLNMASSSQGVFSDSIKRRGSGAYEAINEYLKSMDLGRVKPGFNSQSDYSRPLWENAIKKGKAFGYYNDPNTVYGAMKTVAPVIGAGAVASELMDQKKDGGWLDKYNDGGPVQENYNDYSVSASEGFQGDGYSNVGRNYSPAWGGQFQDGGNLSFISDPKLRNMLEGYKPGFLETVDDYRLPEGYMAGSTYPSTEVSTSIGGEGGEPSYLIPSFKYGQPLQDPVQEFDMTGQYLGGPFKTWQDAEKFGELRHQYVEKGQPLPSPIATSNMAMGGSIPGAVGFTYARTIGPPAPSNGKYAKKTKASAQNGTEMRYYQEGLDFKPKTISRNGSVIKDDMGQWAHPGEVTEIGSNQITMQGVPYPVLGISDTGDTQMMYPDEEYEYDGESVTEYPMMKQGGQLTKLDQLTNFSNYNTPTKGGWLDKYN